MNIVMYVINFMVAALTVLSAALLIYDDKRKIKDLWLYFFMVALFVANGIKWLN